MDSLITTVCYKNGEIIDGSNGEISYVMLCRSIVIIPSYSRFFSIQY